MKAFTGSRRTKGRFIKVRKNGGKAVDARSTMNVPLGLSQIIRPQAAYRWLLPSVAAVTPSYVEMVLRGALMGNHLLQWQLFDLMLDSWPVLSSCEQELVYGVIRRELIFDHYTEEDEKATPSAIEREKLVTSAIRGMAPDVSHDENAKEGTLKDIMDGWFRGLSVLEVLWQTIETEHSGTVTGPKSTFWVHPSTYAIDTTGMIGLVGDGYPTGYATTSTAVQRPAYVTPFPPYKFLVCIHKVRSGTPLMGPLLRPLAWWWCAANFASDWLLNLAQVFGLPFRWANYAQSTPDQTVVAICDMLQNMGSAGFSCKRMSRPCRRRTSA